MKKITLRPDFLEFVKEKHSLLYTNNQRFVHLLIKAVQLCSPLSDGLNVLYSFNDTGRELNIKIKNSKPKLLNNLRANQLHSLLCPPNKQWGRFVEIDPSTNEKITNSERAISNTNALFNKIDESNLHEILKSTFMDVNIGCAAIWIEYIGGKFNFIPITGVTVMPDINGRVKDACFWRRVITEEEFKKTYPDSETRTHSDNKDGKKLYYIDYGYIRNTKDNDGSYFYIHALDKDFKEPLLVEKTACNYLVVVNDTIRPGEGRGRGVILNILEDIERLNSVTNAAYNFIEYVTNPMLLVDHKIPEELMELRGRVITSDMTAVNTKPNVEPVTWQVPLADTNLMMKELEARLEKYFNVLPLGEINQTPVRTATEVAERIADEQKQTLADLARMANQLLGGIIDVIYNVMVKNDEMYEFKSHTYEFVTLQETLQRHDDLNNLLQYAELSQQINGQMSLPMFNNAKKMDDHLKNLLSVPTSLNNSQQEIKAYIQGVQQAQQPAQQSPTPVAPQEPLQPTQIGIPRSIGR